MFELKNHYQVESAFPIIVDNYKVLHFDEFPILFSGTNKFGNKIIGSFSYEDYDFDIVRYLIFIVDDAKFFDFFNNRVTYRNIINDSKELFVIDRDINQNIVSTYHVPLSVIPEDYLPNYNTFIPQEFALSNSFHFAFSLKGKLAEMHKALVLDINAVNNRINSYLDGALNLLRNLSIDPKVYSQPSQNGSYRLNFDIELNQNSQYSLFPVDEDKVGKFLNHYFHYIAYSLPLEENDVLSADENSKHFTSLKISLENVYENINIKNETLEFGLKDSIHESAIMLSEVTDYLTQNDSFNSIELGNYTQEGIFNSVGYLHENYRNLITPKLLYQEEMLMIGNDVVSDSTPQNYRILVYYFNRYSGNGGAKLFYDGEEYQKVRLYVHHEGKDLSQSIFTKSMDEDKVIDVSGIATKINGKYSKIDCYLST